MKSVVHIAPTLSTSDGISAAAGWMIDLGFEQAAWTPRLITARYPGVPLRNETLARLGASAVVLEIPQIFAGRLGRTIAYPVGFAGAVRRSSSDGVIAHIHGIWRYPSLAGAPLLRRLRIPYVISLHGLLMPGPLQRHAHRKQLALHLLERRNLQEAAAILVTSPLERAGVERLDLGLSQIIEVPLGLTRAAADFFARSRRSTNSHRNLILCVARLHPIKRIDALVAAFATLALRHETWDMHIVGPAEDGQYAERLKRDVALHGLSSRVTFLGALTDEALWSKYLAADVFVLPSSSENFGLAVLEALTAGVPVITTTGTIWSRLEELECGWWVEATVDGLGKALAAAMALPEETRRAMGQRGADFVARTYARAHVSQLLANVYDTAMRAGTPRQGRRR